VTDAPVRPIDLAGLSLDSFAGRPVAVLGAARSGIALTRFLASRGATVTLYDARPIEALGPSVADLPNPNVRLLVGPDVDPAAALAGQALVCTSPSISSRFPTTEPRLRTALAAVEDEARVPVVSEIDLFLRLTPSATIGVTGTKGKTTTSALTAAVLARGPEPVLLGGNIGTPLVERLPSIGPRHRVVLELSELQLPTLSRGTDVAVYTHVTSDHLDRHGSLEAYRSVKRRLAELVPPGGALVRNDEDPVVRTYEPPPGSVIVPYRRGEPVPGGVGIVDGWIVDGGVTPLAAGGGSAAGGTTAAGVATAAGGGSAVRSAASAAVSRVVPLDAIRLPGEHNRSNVCAAVAVGLLHGLDADAIAAAVAAFTGVEHRLEHVATIDGLRFINDSQGTQPDAVIAALRSFPRPLVLIAGGRSKGLAIGRLAEVAADRATAAVLIGETADELAEAFGAAGLTRIERAASMDDAVRRAASIAREGLVRHAVAGEAPLATVLLSPAAASFDMFSDYEARGAAFRAAVADLEAASGEGTIR
jgi:UDP-N-acetylmuramoylalanine--D-glutamate ligase